MRDLETIAYTATCKAAWEISRSCQAEILRAIKDGEVTDENDLDEKVHQTVDDFLIYNVTHYVCVWGLRDEEDAIEEGFSSPSCLGDALAAQAFLNLRASLNHAEFEEALQVANDAREEGGES